MSLQLQIMHQIIFIINILLAILSALVAMAFYTLRERKFLGYIQNRKGPNKPTIIAIAVPIADASKLFLKEEKSTTIINLKYYLGAAISILILAMLLWPLFPHSKSLFFIKFSIIYFLCVTSINVYTTFIAGWRSSSKWRLLGALRGVAQTISYEVSISLIIICLIIYPLSINIINLSRDQYMWVIILTMPLIIAWLISILAETHRTPFDFAEGESELVSGFNIEYRRSPFALIFIAEYINILFIRLITISIISKRYTNTELLLKTTIISLIFIWARGTIPRLRYDILINLLWKKILPFTLSWLLFISPVIIFIK